MKNNYKLKDDVTHCQIKVKGLARPFLNSLHFTLSWAPAPSIRKFLFCVLVWSFFKDMDPLDVTRTPEAEQFYPWKERILFWMGDIGLEKTPLKSVPWLQSEQDIASLQFKMVAGARPVLQLHRPLTSMENLQLVDLMARVDHGLMTFM